MQSKELQCVTQVSKLIKFDWLVDHVWPQVEHLTLLVLRLVLVLQLIEQLLDIHFIIVDSVVKSGPGQKQVGRRLEVPMVIIEVRSELIDVAQLRIREVGWLNVDIKTTIANTP